MMRTLEEIANALTPEEEREGHLIAMEGARLAELWLEMLNAYPEDTVMLTAAVAIDVAYATLLAQCDNQVCHADMQGMLVTDDARIELHVASVKLFAERIRQARKETQTHDKTN